MNLKYQIGELFIRGAISDSVIQSCITKLFSYINEENLENVCALLLKIGKVCYEYFAYEYGQSSLKSRPKLRIKHITKETLDDFVDQLAALKQNERITSRIKFMIQVHIFLQINDLLQGCLGSKRSRVESCI